MTASALAQDEEPSHLRCTVPADWTPAGDGKTFLPPGQNVAVTFGPSTPFTGTAEEWMEQYWTALTLELKTLAGPPAAPHGQFLARIGGFQQADGSQAWICLNTLVRDGRGEAVVFMAGTEAQFRAHLPALSDLLQTMSVGAAAPSSKVPVTPARQNQPNTMSRTPTLKDYDFIAPAGWQAQHLADHILLTQSLEPMACKIQILAPQPSSGDLEQDAKNVFATMYPGWQPTRAGEQQYVLSRGFLPRGFEYFMMEGQMSATTADGRYVTEDGAALVIRSGSQIVIVAARHGGLMAHTDCVNKYETWRRFFNGFTVRGASVVEAETGNAAERIVGVWSQSGGGAIGEYVFAANGRYALAGGLGSSSTSRDDRYEYLHIRSHAWDGDGTYAIASSQLTLSRRGENRPEQVRFRFEQVNHGGTGWKDRLWLLKQDRVGQVEVVYERKTTAGTPTTTPPSTASSPSRNQSGAATAEPPAAPPSTSTQSATVRRGVPISEADDVAGFYRLTKRVYNYNLSGAPGSGHTGFRLLYYLLSSDGRVFRGVNAPDAPDGAIERFDFDAAQTRSPKDAGTYTVKGDDVILTMGEAPHQVVVGTRSRDRLKINDPAFTYGEFSFFRSIRALPAPARGPAKPPEVVRVPTASIPAVIDGLPTLTYQAPAGFKDPTGTGRHESVATGQARVEVYDFRRFGGKNFEHEFRATRFRDWLAAASREDEDKIVGETVFEPQTMEGAEQVFSATFQDGSEALRDIVDTGAPRVRSRFAILTSGAVALVDLMIRDGEALQNQQASLNAFSESLKILPAPPPMTREEILAIAGVWEWDGWSGYGREALPHEAQAQIESYVFSVDGRVVWDHGRPDFRTFDFAKAVVAENTVGTYFKRGDAYVMRFGASPYYVYSATIKGSDTLEILGYTYYRKQRVEAK